MKRPTDQPEELQVALRLPRSKRHTRRRSTHVPMSEPLLDTTSIILIIALCVVGSVLVAMTEAGWF